MPDAPSSAPTLVALDDVIAAMSDVLFEYIADTDDRVEAINRVVEAVVRG